MKSNRQHQKLRSDLLCGATDDQRSSDVFEVTRPATLSWVVERTGQVANVCRSISNEVLPPDHNEGHVYAYTGTCHWR